MKPRCVLCPRGGLAPPSCPRTDTWAPFSFPGTLRHCGRGGWGGAAICPVTPSLQCGPCVPVHRTLVARYRVIFRTEVCSPDRWDSRELGSGLGVHALLFSRKAELPSPLLDPELLCRSPNTGRPTCPSPLPNFPLLPKKFRSGGLQETR